MEMSGSLFERLLAAASQRGLEIANASEKRFIRRLNDDDAELMAKGDAKNLVVSRQVRLVRIDFSTQTYFCVFGLAEPEQFPLGLELAELTPAIFAIGALEARIQPKSTISASEIRDAIEGDFIGSPEYDGHDLHVITGLFPQASVYQAIQSEPYLQSDYRVLGALLARSYTEGPIQLQSQTLEKFWLTFETGSDFIPYQNLVQGLMAISWEHLFLEIYRCLEQLYAEPRVSALRDQWHSTLSLRELAAILERHLSWRPREDEALGRIINACDSPCIVNLCNAFGMSDPQKNPSASAENVARKVYDLRNNVVHYRPIHEMIQKEDAEWDSIISALLDVLNQVYDSRGVPFFESGAQAQDALA